MPVRGIRIGILLLALILLAVFAYRAYVEQEGRAQLLTGTVEATRVEVSAKESGYIDEILVVSNSPLDGTARERLEGVATTVIERENVGFDVGGYQDGLDAFGWDRLRSFGELVLFNYTFFAPVNPWKNLFDRVDEWGDVDFWGITEHDEVRPHPFLAKSVMPRHIQSHWIAVRNPLLTSADFREYWRSMPRISSYLSLIHI